MNPACRPIKRAAFFFSPEELREEKPRKSCRLRFWRTRSRTRGGDIAGFSVELALAPIFHPLLSTLVRSLLRELGGGAAPDIIEKPAEGGGF